MITISEDGKITHSRQLELLGYFVRHRGVQVDIPLPHFRL
jgi:hypothetical protein